MLTCKHGCAGEDWAQSSDAAAAKGLPQEELAHRSGIHQTYLSGVERGKRNPTAVVMQKIALALDTDIERLVAKRTPRQEG